MNAGRSRTLAALALQCAALAALYLALLGASWLDPRGKPRLLLLIDRSSSVPRAQADKVVAEVERAARAAGAGEVLLLEFAGRTAPPAQRPVADVQPLEPGATDIESALEAALAAHAQSPFAGIVMVSDGRENVGDAARALRHVQAAGLPLQWIAVGTPPPETGIAAVVAPQHARVGQRIAVTVQLDRRTQRPLRVTAVARDAGGQTQTARVDADAVDRATIELDADRSGAVVVDVTLADPATGRTLDAMADAALIDVAPPAPLLYARGSNGPLARSLARGGWSLDVVPSTRLDTRTDGLDRYQAVVLDDVAVADASPRFWSALATAVRQGGLGLMVLGGERSFARGGYRGSTLESVLPVLSEPAALDQPAAVVFAVDKSGSMGQGSGGIDRFQLAQRAVVETARGLTARDSLGLVLFDVTPRVLIPLGPAPAATEALARDWRASPNGGTRLAPALDAAIAELERSGSARRMLVLVTDGFVEGASPDELRRRLQRAGVETIALAVGPDADVAALEHIVGATSGQVLRVQEAAELPDVMRSGLERRRARVQRGDVAVEQRQALPFPPGTWTDWPAVAAHAVTRPQAGAVVAVQTRRGEPLIAFQNVGRGRVVAVTSGLGPWTPAWLPWRQWPRLAGGLADWISGAAQGGAVALSVSDLPRGLLIEADLPGDWSGPAHDGMAITVDTPATRGLALAADLVAPGRLRATLPDAGPGLYTFGVSTPGGAQRRLHLRRQRSEGGTWGINPALDAWRAAGLVGHWRQDDPVPRAQATTADHPPDRTLVGLALALFLSGVLVDRSRPGTADLRAALRRWRAWTKRPAGAG